MRFLVRQLIKVAARLTILAVWLAVSGLLVVPFPFCGTGSHPCTH